MPAKGSLGLHKATDPLLRVLMKEVFLCHSQFLPKMEAIP